METTRKEIWSAYHKLVSQVGTGQVFVCPVDEWTLGGEPIATTRTRGWLPNHEPWITVGLYVSMVDPARLAYEKSQDLDSIWLKVLGDATTSGGFFESTMPDIEIETDYPTFEE